VNLLARRQEYMISAAQLAEIGLDRFAISKRTSRGDLFRVLPTVYSIVPPPYRWASRVWAAVLWGGEHGVLSRYTAANWQAVLKPRPNRKIDITLPTRRRPNEIAVPHYARTFHREDVTEHERLRITTWARTALDLAATEPPRITELVLNGAVIQSLFDYPLIDAVCERNAGHHGIAPLRQALARIERATTLTDSQLEEAFLAVCDAHRIPRPATQRWITSGHRLDFHWPENGLTVEIDSWRYHRHADAFHSDREKDIVLRERGGKPPLRFTDWMVECEPARVGRVTLAAYAEAERGTVAPCSTRTSPPGSTGSTTLSPTPT
jgi:hypothetical protein